MKWTIRVGKLDLSYQDLEVDLDVRALVRAMGLRRFRVDIQEQEIEELEPDEPEEEEETLGAADQWILKDGYRRFFEMMEAWVENWEDKDPTTMKKRSDLLSSGVHANIIKYINAAGGLTQAAWAVLENLGHTKEEVLDYVGVLVQTASIMYPPLVDTWNANDQLEAQ
jgi:hypothetical protein